MKKKLLLLLPFFFPLIGNASDYVGCTRLKSLQLPECTAIGDSAFVACSDLEQLSFPYSDPPIYGENAFVHPETIAIDLDEQDKTIIEKWREIPEWNVFIWKTIITNIKTPDNKKWKIETSKNNLIISGLIPDTKISFITATGLQYHYTSSRDGKLSLTLPFGFYIINQQNKTERIVLTK